MSKPDQDTKPQDAEPPQRSLKALVIRGSTWTLAGYGGSQFLRLVSGIVMSYFLVAETFGLMGLVGMVMYGLQMFSDVGAGPAIIRNKRGDDPDFLNTAWTIQVGRGFILWICSCILAWPVARFYEEPRLVYLIPVVGLTAVIAGFESTTVHSARRHIALGKLSLMELITQSCTIIVMLAWAAVSPSVWALVAGGIAGSLVHMILSHTLLRGFRNRFHWDKEAARALFNFGKWIYLSSALFFISRQGDILLMGKFMKDLAMLGVYTRAQRLSEPVVTLNERLARQVLMPALSRCDREQPDRVREVFYRGRLALDALFLMPSGVLMVVGAFLVGVLFPEEYAPAGWMLQVLAVRIAMQCLLEPCQQCLVATNRPRYAFILTAGRTAWILIGLPVGWRLGGAVGFVWAVALSEIPVWFILWFGMWKHRLIRLSREALSFAMIGVGMLAGWGLLYVAEYALAAMGFNP